MWSVVVGFLFGVVIGVAASHAFWLLVAMGHNTFGDLFD